MKILLIEKTEFEKIISLFNKEIGRFIIFVFVLFFDSLYFSKNITNSQVFINTLMGAGFIKMYLRATPRVKESMIYAVIIGLIGEHLFSIGLDMYTYRLEKVPLYVPLGHGALYGRILMFSKASVIKKNSEAVEQFFSTVIVLLSLVYLLFFKDVFGFVMTIIVFLMMLKRPKDRVFFYSMYLLVAVLEIGGTAFGCWKWPSTAFGVFPLLPSNNPPSGISLFYFLLDISCFYIYILVNYKTWARFKTRFRKNA